MSGSNSIYALITGASRGLGKAFAYELAGRKVDLLLVSLPGEGLNNLCKQLTDKFGVDSDYLEADLTKINDISKIVDWVSREYRVNILINNAGTGGTMPFDKTDVDYLENIIDLNIRALVLLTHKLLPELRSHDKAYILNVSSMFSFSPIGYKTIYPASKSFVYYFSRGLNEELKGSGISVSVLHPGPIRTNFDVRNRIGKQGFFGKLGLYSAEGVASISVNRMFKRKPVIIPGLGNYINWFLLKAFPDSIKASVLSKRVKREIKTQP